MGRRKIKPIEGEQLSLLTERFNQGDRVICPQGEGRVYLDHGPDGPVWVEIDNTALPFPSFAVRRAD